MKLQNSSVNHYYTDGVAIFEFFVDLALEKAEG